MAHTAAIPPMPPFARLAALPLSFLALVLAEQEQGHAREWRQHVPRRPHV
jgi:hypothetical protein